MSIETSLLLEFLVLNWHIEGSWLDVVYTFQLDYKYK